ncbi:hypothetical protein [Aquibacillus rhizosphaerae]|uniref:Uncharacterized protein n=1 Tax=Aquibacillus rhizosphaerae TaxID=3051431 RepID=A0ABT7LAT7_9BACI|nr:hypothetical protein [Aquibacillus sp. LR5S19]MDL4842963.1 hypothetical protein [Aquibacillus sp. LR5S19]
MRKRLWIFILLIPTLIISGLFLFEGHRMYGFDRTELDSDSQFQEKFSAYKLPSKVPFKNMEGYGSIISHNGSDTIL